MQISETVTEAARRHFAQHFGRKAHRIVRTQSDRHPDEGFPVHRFLAVVLEAGNSAPVELILDDEGRVVELANLRRRVFIPRVEPVRPELVGAAQVTIDPSSNDLRLGECDTVRETITVTIPPSAAVAPADIYFLADNTGSMGPAIGAVQTGANAMFAALSAYPNLQFGVGEYQDFDNAGDTSLAFQNRQAITPSQPAVTAAIGGWTALPGAGGDGPEAQLYALDQVAGSAAIAWRPGVKRIVVWFGDAPGHDPICKAASGLGYDITEASVTAKLQAAQITVLALSLNDGSGYANGLNDDPTNLLGPLNAAYTACGAPGGTPGQATRIAAATGGIVVNSVDPTTIVSTIIAQLKALLTINNVHLQPVGAIAPFVTSIVPPSYGPLPGDQANTLTFEVTLSGDVVDCATRDRVFTGAIDVVVDGSVVAAKPTRITVPACKYTYAVKFVCGTQAACGCACGPVRPGIYATEINILNPKCKEATITKRFVPLVFAGAVTGREPAVVQARATERIVLPSGAATMDDCCRIGEVLYGATPAAPMPLTIGFLEIISDQELHVTAVYTASDSEGHGLSVDVQVVPGRLT
ncbi:MAG TPA: vWA domain-containing protein [Acetobacteraceae bacterium]|nr:vWA domain-containing protein [Acetobacteraceae bacterium]